MTVLGTITANGVTRSLTTYDYEWALKSVFREAGPDPSHEWEWGAVLWTMAHRWLGNYGRPGESFGEYIQRFSQPVNPDQIGVIHTYDRTVSDPTGIRRSQERDARIRELRARPVASMERQYPQLAAYVMKFMRGGVPRTPYAMFADFAAPGVGGGGDRLLVTAGGNAFYSEPWITGLQIAVKYRPSGTQMALLGLAAVAAAAAYYFLVYRKRALAGLGASPRSKTSYMRLAHDMRLSLIALDERDSIAFARRVVSRLRNETMLPTDWFWQDGRYVIATDISEGRAQQLIDQLRREAK